MLAHPLRLLAALALGAGALAACGDDDAGGALGTGSNGDDTTGSGAGLVDDDGSDPDDWPPNDVRGSGSAGTVTVDGETFLIDTVRTCDITELRTWWATNDSRREPLLRIHGAGLLDPENPELSRQVEITLTRSEYQSAPARPVQDHHEIRWRGAEGSSLEVTALGATVWTQGAAILDGPPLDWDGARITGEANTRGDGTGTPISIDLAAPGPDLADCD